MERINKAAATALDKEMDECEQELGCPCPFAYLPKSTSVLDEFRHKYPNDVTLSVDISLGAL